MSAVSVGCRWLALAGKFRSYHPASPCPHFSFLFGVVVLAYDGASPSI